MAEAAVYQRETKRAIIVVRAGDLPAEAMEKFFA